MAKVVLGIGTSHSPMVSSPPELWESHARGYDMLQKDLIDVDGGVCTYAQLLEKTEGRFAQLASYQSSRERHERCQAAITRLAEIYATTRPDVAIIIGEDQHEQFSADYMPALLVHWGDSVLNTPRKYGPDAMPSLKASAWAYGKKDETHSGRADLGLHIIETMVQDGFDVAQSRRLPKESAASIEGIGHAFTFIYHRIMGGNVTPHVPIILNTYYPPNQPTPKRCFEIGRIIKKAVEIWEPDLRVAVIASGGLSHFVLNEKIDLAVIDALQNNDTEFLKSIPRKQMQSGTSEILNWIALGATVDDLRMNLIDYVPCYRSAAGTGIGMAFASWT